jgi:diguanylate cyclase (GGDEF)-like protein
VDLAHLAQAHIDSQRLLQLAQELGNSLNLSETLAVIASQLQELIPSDAIGIYSIDGATISPLLVSGGHSRVFLGIGGTASENLSFRAASTEQPVLNGNPREDAPFTPLASALAIPLNGNGGFRGALTLYRTAAGAFTEAELALGMTLRRKIAIAVENALAFQNVVQHSNCDELTGLPNGRALFLQLDGEIARSRRTGSFLALLTCDVFAFRRINERYGKARCDQLLQHIARLLKEHCREYDTVARTGSDEFALLLPEFPRDAFESKREGVANAARRAGRDILNEDFVEFAVGWASFPEDGMDAESLLAVADSRLFEARRVQKATPHAWMFSR